MSQENALVLSIFDSETAADEAAVALKQWDKATEDIKLGGIGVLVKDADGQIKQHKVGPRRGGKGAGVGLVLGIVAAIPTGGLSLAAGAGGGLVGGAIVGSFVKKGFHELSQEDATRISQELDAGHAALGVLVAPANAEAVAGELTRLGGRSETHVISDEELKDAETSIAAAPALQPSEGADQTQAPPQA